MCWSNSESFRGLPKAFRVDNGPELRAQAFVDWCEAHDIELRFIQPGEPQQNAFVDRFNSTYHTKYSTRTCSTVSSRCGLSRRLGAPVQRRAPPSGLRPSPSGAVCTATSER